MSEHASVASQSEGNATYGRAKAPEAQARGLLSYIYCHMPIGCLAPKVPRALSVIGGWRRSLRGWFLWIYLDVPWQSLPYPGSSSVRY